jgi:hypothetical protein
MTEKEKMILWESLHECYAISNVVSHSSNYVDTKDGSQYAPSYATLLERSSKLLLDAIAILDNLPTNPSSELTN